MRSFDELEALWLAGPAPPRQRGVLRLIVTRVDDGVHETPAASRIDAAGGLNGDRWARAEKPNQESQVTLMNVRVAELLTAGAQPLHLPGDNLLVDLDTGVAALPVGARVRIGLALLEITAKPHTGCKKFAARFGQEALRWVNWRSFRERRLRGVNCRVIEGGEIAVGDPVEVFRPV